jgi:malate dehydrogenase (oxaloacetate-decarboxylating)(NADP+)
MARSMERDALEYHEGHRPGKLMMVPSKPCVTQRDLSLAYSPGVAVPCLEIAKEPLDAFRYTARGNLVGVISNGTAVLGLGNIGALAGKPVMEGKGVLFKKFADIDVFDIEVDETDVDAFCETGKRLEPTFGGINLEDIKAPECFHIERRLKEEMGIPVFHDDQHGTAIISTAAVLNVLEMVDKKIEDLVVVVAGAGAAGIACSEMLITAGARRENIYMTDSKGVITTRRDAGMNEFKERFAQDTDKETLEDALKGADVFLGLSKANTVSQEMVRSMNRDPIVLAMANPDPEITFENAHAAREDVIYGSGRSDYPNQVNNVLGFPFIFRGALDVRATHINEEMKMAASRALAELAKEDVPDSVRRAYGGQEITFGREYIIPKPFDPRVLTWVAPAVAKAACDTGVAKHPITDWDAYRETLAGRISRGREAMRTIIHRARQRSARIVFPEAEEEKVLRACEILVADGIADPVLVGNETKIRARIEELGLDLPNVEIVDVESSEHLDDYAEELWRLRQRKGLTPRRALTKIRNPLHYGLMMVRKGHGEGLVCGLNRSYPKTIKPALQIIGLRRGSPFSRTRTSARWSTRRRSAPRRRSA